MNLRQRPIPAAGGRGTVYPPPPPPRLEEAFNIIPINNLLTDHPSLRYPEVRAASAALRTVGDLRKPPFTPWHDGLDLMDWLGLFFGFQRDNVRNQREHLVLHLANSQMRLQPPPVAVDVLETSVLRRFRRKLLQNYTSWCSYLGRRSNVHLSRRRDSDLLRRELLYVCLYLLIWGEAANLRFTPECISYIYHHMAMELNQVLNDDIDENTGLPFIPSISGENAFLNRIITPIYKIIKSEVESSRNGTAPHSAWRNYDDINEYFWSKRCFRRLNWPINPSCKFFLTRKQNGVGKTGFVEQRTFWNVFRSFDRLWVLLFLFLQAAIIVAWEGTEYPWHALDRRDVQVKLLTVFITWACLRLLQSVLDAGTQYSLVSRETMWLGVRMVLKSLFASTWIVVFSVFYARIWSQKNSDGVWSTEANQKIFTFLKAGLAFVIPELLALVLFILPWIRNVIEEADWMIIYLLTWWFHTRIFVGRGIREGLINNIKYTLFWVTVLASKFSFSYFLQIKPLVAPTKALLNLKDATYYWHEFFNNTNRVAVILLWVPVVLVYLMDLQIWYSIFSSLIGGAIGLFLHLGEIRSIEQLRLRFQFFASALQFNFKPEDQILSPQATLVHKFRDAIHRVKLRYGLGRPYHKIESNQVEATRFALIWNEIIIAFREEDLISDQELELMELPPNSWDIRVIRWPCFLLCNELLFALRQAGELGDLHDRELWFRMCKNEYRRCAIVEAYDSIRYLLPQIIKYETEEYSIVTKLFMEIDHYIQYEKFTEVYKMTVLPQIHTQLVSLIELLMMPKKDSSKVVNCLQALYELSVRDFPRVKKSIAELRQEGLALLNPPTNAGFLFENAVEFPDDDDSLFQRQLRRLQTILTSRDSMHNVPKNLEARRRISFFSNSLFMNMPRAPQVEKMVAFSVLTPYYEEEVLYGKESLRSPNEDGISTLFYLQKIYEDEWTNFMERMHREGIEDDSEIWTIKARDLRLWASYRGQTLSRTIRGMMYYYRALKMLAFLDSASEVDIRKGSLEISSLGSLRQHSGLDGVISSNKPPSSTRNLARAGSVRIFILFGISDRIRLDKRDR